MSEQTNYRQPQVGSASCRPPDYYKLLVETLEELKPKLIRFAYKRLKDKEAAVELYGETSIRILRAGESDKIESYKKVILKKIIYRTTRNLAFDNNRQWFVRCRGELSDMLASSINPEAEVIENEMNEVLTMAIEYLPDPYRSTIILCHYEELSYDEAAKILGLSNGSFKTRLHRARVILRQKLEENGYGELCQDRSLRHRQATKDSVTTPSSLRRTDH